MYIILVSEVDRVVLAKEVFLTAQYFLLRGLLRVHLSYFLLLLLFLVAIDSNVSTQRVLVLSFQGLHLEPDRVALHASPEMEGLPMGCLFGI